MITNVTKDIKFSVETNYQREHSQPAHGHFVFNYMTTVENNTVRLKAHHWEVIGAIYPKYNRENNKIVGKQPILEPTQIYQFESGYNLQSGVGKMSGYYIMDRILDEWIFNVEIPEFIVMTPFKLN